MNTFKRGALHELAIELGFQRRDWTYIVVDIAKKNTSRHIMMWSVISAFVSVALLSSATQLGHAETPPQVSALLFYLSILVFLYGLNMRYSVTGQIFDFFWRLWPNATWIIGLLLSAIVLAGSIYLYGEYQGVLLIITAFVGAVGCVRFFGLLFHLIDILPED
jgi:hypothetical protein